MTLENLLKKLRAEVAKNKPEYDEYDKVCAMFNAGVSAGRYELAEELLAHIPSQCPACKGTILQDPPDKRPHRNAVVEHHDCTFPNRGSRWTFPESNKER